MDNFAKFCPTKHDVHNLINLANDHPLGTDFLINGSLDAVSATFSVHAFIVEEARNHLNNNKNQPKHDGNNGSIHIKKIPTSYARKSKQQ